MYWIFQFEQECTYYMFSYANIFIVKLRILGSGRSINDPLFVECNKERFLLVTRDQFFKKLQNFLFQKLKSFVWRKYGRGNGRIGGENEKSFKTWTL